jgi:Fe2+ transport system protein B
VEPAGESRAFIYKGNLFDRGFRDRKHPVVALAGNPNTGKSTVFNALTGLRQHTGNWPGKTVLLARGLYTHRGRIYELVDLPGSYSLHANSPDEEVTRDFICWSRPDATIIVVDATCLERNLNLVLQILEINDRVAVCLNLIDEAGKKHVNIDHTLLEQELGVPVVPCTARVGIGLKDLITAVARLIDGKLITRPYRIRYPNEVEAALEIVEPRIRHLVPLHLRSRWVALRLLTGDVAFYNAWKEWFGQEPPIQEVTTG